MSGAASMPKTASEWQSQVISISSLLITSRGIKI